MAQTSERHEVGHNEQANIYEEHLRGVNQYRQTNKRAALRISGLGNIQVTGFGKQWLQVEFNGECDFLQGEATDTATERCTLLQNVSV